MSFDCDAVTGTLSRNSSPPNLVISVRLYLILPKAASGRLRKARSSDGNIQPSPPTLTYSKEPFFFWLFPESLLTSSELIYKLRGPLQSNPLLFFIMLTTLTKTFYKLILLTLKTHKNDNTNHQRYVFFVFKQFCLVVLVNVNLYEYFAK